ncbi:coil containing protein [Vibrio phage vB_VhaP_PG11]|nr:coil containing protein [Vibrio phage vB_VhaP_PG11]
MSDQEFTELDSLKQVAENKGISFHPKIGLEALKAKIAEFDAGLEEKTPTVKKAQTKIQKRQALAKEKLKLVRVRIACMNPAKREWQGEWLSCGNSTLGFHTKYVLFDHDYHLTQFMVGILQDKKFRMSKDVPDGKGGKYRKNYFVKEYNVEILDPLTQEELDALAADQAKRQAIGD